MFVSTTFVKKLDDMCIVSLTSREKFDFTVGFKVLPVKIAGRELPVDLMVLEMVDYDVILGMDRLSEYNLPSFV